MFVKFYDIKNKEKGNKDTLPESEKNVRVIYVSSEGAAVMDVKNELKTFQKGVDGYIEVFRFASDAAIICNEEGLLKGMPIRVLVVDKGDKIVTGIAGNFFIVGSDPECDDFIELSEKRANELALQCCTRKLLFEE